VHTFLIGQHLRIIHEPDWSGIAVLCYDGGEFRIPGGAARELVQSIRGSERRAATRPDPLSCAICETSLGVAWIAADEESTSAVCPRCTEALDAARDGGADAIAKAVASRIAPDD
jgi:hypothetical protein